MAKRPQSDIVKIEALAVKQRNARREKLVDLLAQLPYYMADFTADGPITEFSIAIQDGHVQVAYKESQVPLSLRILLYESLGIPIARHGDPS